MVDTEKLISVVYERKPLWDVQSKNFHNREVARKLWLEIHFLKLPYFSIDNAHLMYNAHPKLFRHSF